MNDKGFASFVKTLSVLQLAALRDDAAKFDDVEALRVIDEEFKTRQKEPRVIRETRRHQEKRLE